MPGRRAGGIHQVIDRLLAKAAELRAADDLEGAARLYSLAAIEAPDDPEPHHHLGGIQVRQGRLDLAEAAYRRALERAPQADATARVLGVLLLSQGRYEEGFAYYEARHALPEMAKPALPFSEWRGEAVVGKKVLIWPEQGLGDQIQFARFAPLLKAQGADVTLLCSKPLARLFSERLGVSVQAAEGDVTFPDPDFWVMACSLAARFGASVDEIPSQPYLTSASDVTKLAEAPKVRVGLVTRGNPAHANDANRSLPPSDAARLRAMKATVIPLDPAETGARDFADTAAMVDQLDLVVCVDTAVAHLAGAMGKPCWVLIPIVETDWRWLRERSDSPWYPSLRLYRQDRPGDWSQAIDRIEADLRVFDRHSG